MSNYDQLFFPDLKNGIRPFHSRGNRGGKGLCVISGHVRRRLSEGVGIDSEVGLLRRQHHADAI